MTPLPPLALDGSAPERPSDAPRPPSNASQSRHARRRKLLIVGADITALVVATIAASRVSVDPSRAIYVAPVASFAACIHQHLYRARILTRRLVEFQRVCMSVMFGTVSCIVAGYVAGSEPTHSAVVVFGGLAVTLVMLEREGLRSLFRELRRLGRIQRRVLVVGANAEGRQLAGQFVDDPSLGYDVAGIVTAGDEAPLAAASTPVVGGLDDLHRLVDELNVTTVVLAASALDVHRAQAIIRDLIHEGVHVELSPSLIDIAAERLTVQRVGRFPMVYVEPSQQGGWRAGAKRLFDIVVATIALIATAPIVLAAAVAIRLDSPGGVFFAQNRVGQGGTEFRLFKLRTMVEDAEALRAALLDANESDGPLFKIREDPRVTPIGRWLRQFSVDEIPQLWNVLRGEMSLVGPRPALPCEADDWSEALWDRVRVKPGITGMWQVNGRSEANFDDYVRHDLYYVDNWSLLADLGVMLKTVPAVIRRHGAS